MKESIETALQIISEIKSNPINVKGHQFFISVSVGMTYVEHGKPLKVLVNEADMAMYDAKRNGGSILRVH
ncbi:GGDEF domain-containing protein [Paenisporosarcina antarctica]|uniref:Diguanylate cyclase n=1 Tax=Paenisporosarcina antarctica TaxID=417367 RepID=A0A4P7A1A2_9BACL|nr:diguanylate cyclase [Paenisporosarcina antarctica]QBP42671.1 diguanylate cyclase [Paenisporosarcina antarctica]